MEGEQVFDEKEVVKIGMRYDAGVKAEYSLDFQGSDLLFAAIPATLPAYMLINPTGLYDILNRDGSVKIGPFCTGKLPKTVHRRTVLPKMPRTKRLR